MATSVAGGHVRSARRARGRSSRPRGARAVAADHDAVGEQGAAPPAAEAAEPPAPAAAPAAPGGAAGAALYNAAEAAYLEWELDGPTRGIHRALASSEAGFAIASQQRDALIEFVKMMLAPAFALEVLDERAAILFERLEAIIEEYRLGQNTKLKKLVPTIGTFYTPLQLVHAWKDYDAYVRISKRGLVAPSFSEIRHILNLAQIYASTEDPNNLRLVTFDGDKTLYEDGGNFLPDSKLVDRLIILMRKKLYVAVVTAAGYKGNPTRYEERLGGLLRGMRKRELTEEECNRLLVLGGESNFLFQCNGDFTFEEVAPERWLTPAQTWCETGATPVLDVAEETLLKLKEELNIPARVIRKELAVGLVKRPDAKRLEREQLDEVVLTVQNTLNDVMAAPNSDVPMVPFCAFNGGQDAWVDVGNKYIGLRTLQDFLGIEPKQCIHVGDQFTAVGNDISTRDACPTLWISGPEETGRVVKMISRAVRDMPTL